MPPKAGRNISVHCYRNDVFGSEGGGFLKPYDQYKRMAVRKIGNTVSLQEYIWVPMKCYGNRKECDRLASHSVRNKRIHLML